MLNFQIITIFPELFSSFKKFGLISKAIKEGKISINETNLRDFAINSHGQIDDTPYGGGSGMVLRPEPVKDSIKHAKSLLKNAKTILFTPRGEVFNQKKAKEIIKEQSNFILLCTRYEGIDQRAVENYIDLELNMGDYIMMGGEIPAMAFIEATSRLIPKVLGNPESIKNESFENNLLEHPQYTKPKGFLKKEVPEVLVSGNHQKIKEWRKKTSLKDTANKRPELVNKYQKRTCELNVSLIHYPVTNKEGKVITSSLTNLDIHDIARSCRTFNISNYYIVHPVNALRLLGAKILDHWGSGYGSTYNPNRKDALSIIKIKKDFDDVLIDIEKRTKKLPKIISTSATPSKDLITFSSLNAKLKTSTSPHLLILGTGWGLEEEFIKRADYRLEPIYGTGKYNHLSVRAALAIMLDRLS